VRPALALALFTACGHRAEPRASEPQPAPVTASVAPADAPAPPDAGKPRPPELVELSRILTPGKGPTIDPTIHPNFPRDPSWDPRHVWLVSYEQDGRDIKITGNAASETDIVQVMKNMQISTWFRDIAVVETERIEVDGQPAAHFVVKAHSTNPNPPHEHVSITSW
jgi:hypothetical protein